MMGSSTSACMSTPRRGATLSASASRADPADDTRAPNRQRTLRPKSRASSCVHHRSLAWIIAHAVSMAAVTSVDANFRLDAVGDHCVPLSRGEPFGHSGSFGCSGAACTPYRPQWPDTRQVQSGIRNLVDSTLERSRAPALQHRLCSVGAADGLSAASSCQGVAQLFIGGGAPQRILKSVPEAMEDLEPPPNEWTPVVGSLSPEVSNGTSTSVIYRRVQTAGR
ncbi:hypothetical protein AB7M56_001423 [Bradyrhizobium elkanii]